jgi:hypothetical protein
MKAIGSDVWTKEIFREMEKQNEEFAETFPAR